MTAGRELHGIFPYLVSPIDEATGWVRERVLRDMVEHLIRAGVHGLSPLGSTGEFAYLSFEQRCAIVRIVVDQAAGRVPVVPGVAAFATGEARRQVEAYVELGADALVAILQTMFPVSRAGIEAYFMAIADASPRSIALYTNPGVGVADLTPEIVAALSHHPNVAYVKDASGNTGRILSILERVEGRVKVFSASAHVPLLVLRLGGVGWWAGPACLVPRACVRLYELCRAGRWDEAMVLQRPLWRVNEVFQKYALAACVKAGLTLQGFDVGPPIAPQSALGAAAVDEVRAALAMAESLEKWVAPSP